MNARNRHPAARWLAPLALVGLLVAGVAGAQGSTPAPSPEPAAKGGRMARLGLTAQQRQELRKVALERAAANTETRAALQKARLELARMMIDDKPAAAALDRKSAEIGQLQGKLLRARLDTALRMRAVLTPEQRARMGPGMWRQWGRGWDGPRRDRVRSMRRIHVGGDGPMMHEREM